MKYMLIINTIRNGYEQYMNWPKATLEANATFMQAFAAKLKASGELVSTAGLATPVEARRVRAGKDGRPVTDGVFPETKEFLAGYWIIDVASAERADEIAAEASTAPCAPMRHSDGTMVDQLWIEVREIMRGRHDL